MTRQRAAELWPVMKAFGEGRIIQCLNHGGGNWRDMPDAPGWFDDIAYNYRIKPEPREWWETRAEGYATVEHETFARAQKHVDTLNKATGGKFSVFHVKEVL